MKHPSENFKQTRKLTYIGIALGISYWIVESVMDTYVYGLGILRERFLAPDLNELEMRSLAVCLLITLGVYSQYMVNKLEKTEKRLARMNECFLAFGPDPMENINRLTNLCGELLGASAAFYNRLDHGLLCSWGQWHMPPELKSQDNPEGHICYDVINKGSDEVTIIRHLNETLYARTDPAIIPHGLKTYVGQPVRLGEDVVGSLCALYQFDYVPRDEDKRLLGIIASAVGVEEVRRQARNALRESEKQLRTLSARLLSAQELERKRVARQLHDSIGQSLSAIKYSIEETLEQTKGSNQDFKALEAAVPMIRQVVDEVRRIQKNLRPSMLDDLGIIATISWFCREFQTIYSGVTIEREMEVRESEVPEALKTVIYRILQEAMNNIAKHSKADFVHLSLEKTDTGLGLTIRDNGQGFDIERVLTAGSGGGIGLSSMRERTELSGGAFSIGASAETGTEIKAFWLWDKMQLRD